MNSTKTKAFSSWLSRLFLQLPAVLLVLIFASQSLNPSGFLLDYSSDLMEQNDFQEKEKENKKEEKRVKSDWDDFFAGSQCQFETSTISFFLRNNQKHLLSKPYLTKPTPPPDFS